MYNCVTVSAFPRDIDLDLAARDVATLRKLLLGSLSADELDAFCSDCFPDIKRRFASAISDMTKITLVLESVPLAEVLTHLRGWKPSAFARFHEEQDRRLELRLQELTERLAQAMLRDANTSAIEEEILAIKRHLRHGHEVRQGEFLGNRRYLLDQLIGHGGYASVWKAYDTKLRRTVAVKILHGQWAKDRSHRERFQRGARQMCKLEHPSIVRVLEEVQDENGLHYFVMNYISGGDLRQAVIKDRRPVKEVMTALVEIGEALHFAHQQGIYHRDVKPANILLDGQRAYLTDFDLVWARDTTGGTRTGSLGTFIYASPESYRDSSHPTPATDVFSLGMTAVFALYGDDLGLEVLRDPEWFIEKLAGPAQLRRVIAKATQFQSHDRFVSMKDFCEALRDALSAEDSSAPPLLFLAAAHADAEFVDEALRHFGVLERLGHIRVWHESMRIPGKADWETDVETHLQEADFIACLLSTDFLISNFLDRDVIRRAIRRHRVIPVLLRACAWNFSRLGNITCTPADHRPVTEWANRDAAWQTVSLTIREIMLESHTQSQTEELSQVFTTTEEQAFTTFPVPPGAWGRRSVINKHQRIPRILLLSSTKDDDLLSMLHHYLMPLCSQGRVFLASHMDILAGDNYDDWLRHRLSDADIIVPLISSNIFSQGRLTFELLEKCMAQYETRGRLVCPIFARPVALFDWALAGLPSLPSNGRAVTLWDDQDEAWIDVINALWTALEGQPQATDYRISVLYARQDQKWQHQFFRHLLLLTRSQRISLRFFSIDEQINTDDLNAYSDIFLFLLSADFLADGYELFNKLLERIRRPYADHKIRGINLTLRPCVFQESALAAFRALPNDGTWIAQAENPDRSFTQVISELMEILNIS